MTYGVIAGIVLIFFGRELSLIFVNKSDAAVLTASAKYLFYAGFSIGRSVYSTLAECVRRALDILDLLYSQE